jgi:pseudouridine kinase
MPHRIVCIGNATLDRTYALTVDARQGTKNPAIARPTAFGGVARNVAENLARLGVATALVACVGDDDAGRAVLTDCQELGIDISGCVVSQAVPTAQYAAILDVRNDLIMGASDMRAVETLSARAVLDAASGDAAWTFADCNLAPETLAAVVAAPRPVTGRLAVNTVSVAKAERLPARLDGLDLLVCNAAEAAAYLAMEGAPPEALAQALHERGAHASIMTLGDRGALVASPQGRTHVPAREAHVVDVTGAGDALIAGALYALLGGASMHDAVQMGTALASLTVEVPTPVHRELTQAMLRERLG